MLTNSAFKTGQTRAFRCSCICSVAVLQSYVRGKQFPHGLMEGSTVRSNFKRKMRGKPSINLHCGHCSDPDVPNLLLSPASFTNDQIAFGFLKNMSDVSGLQESRR